jgi:uncharacterized protein
MTLRRHLTRRKVLMGVGATVTLAAVDALAIEPGWLEVSRHTVALEGLPAALEGFVIAQITDAHLTKIGRVEAATLAAIRRAQPQLVVLTGDLIDSHADLDALADLCAGIVETDAQVLATLGNWEHWGKLSRDRLRRTYAKAGARLLVDEWHGWDGGSGLAIYASDDSTAGRPRRPADERRSAIDLLLTHSPAFVDEPSLGRRFDLCLAGHTHGGQIRAGSLAPVTPPGSGRFVAGWYDTPSGPLYVSRGTGTSLVPARFCCRPELPLFELVRG